MSGLTYYELAKIKERAETPGGTGFSHAREDISRLVAEVEQLEWAMVGMHRLISSAAGRLLRAGRLDDESRKELAAAGGIYIRATIKGRE